MNNIIEFLKSVTVLDTETTDMNATVCEIVEVGSALYENYWTSANLLLGSNNPIAFKASAKNNISRKMIAGLPTFSQNIDKIKTILNWENAKYFIAHNSKYDQTALETAFKRFNSENDISICKDNTKWICTYRLSKHILMHDFDDIQYNLSYLRYALDLDISSTIGVHRAGEDALVTAKLLEKLIEIAVNNKQIDVNLPIGEKLNKLCWSFIPITHWPIGKHKGELLTELPNSYYTWALKNIPRLDENSIEYDIDLTESIVKVLSNRLDGI